MELNEVKIGTKVIYARGAKEPLIGKCGIITEFDPKESGIVMVEFDNGCSPCYYKNLDIE